MFIKPEIILIYQQMCNHNHSIFAKGNRDLYGLVIVLSCCWVVEPPNAFLRIAFHNGFQQSFRKLDSHFPYGLVNGRTDNSMALSAQTISRVTSAISAALSSFSRQPTICLDREIRAMETWNRQLILISARFMVLEDSQNTMYK